ncbi:unnamed protein product [Auanema sp. JU1783]|nr:unnamed protein product [Auanema sp. JU1783]
MSDDYVNRAVDIKQYVEDRAVQVAQLLEMVNNSRLVSGEVTKGPRTAAQRLPRHMRRRAMAYEIRRFPKGLRSFASAHVKLSKHRKKPPSRFFRRRPTNLLQNYIRRNRSKTWLETHIWHAKRFYMIDRWGYRLPDRSFQRNFRPCYRDAIRHCSIRDKSFLNCMTISHSSQEELMNLLKPLFDNRASLTVAAKAALNCQTEISSMLYEPNKYPQGFIGPCRLQWVQAGETATLVLWVHPLCSDQLINHLTSLLGLSKVETNEEPVDLASITTKEDWRLKIMKFQTVTYRNEEKGIVLNDLKDQMVRLRLYGPYALPVLSQTLKLVDIPYSTGYEENHNQWRSYFSNMKCGELKDGAVFTLLVEDPRTARPQKRTVPEEHLLESLKPAEVSKPNPGLWSLDGRIEVLEKRLTDSEMKQLNGKTVGNTPETPAKIPVQIVIRNTGSGFSDTLTGCELITPSGFGLDFWVTAQYFTAHASGNRDDEAAHLESKRLSFPADSFDCKAGFEDLKRILKESEEKYFKRPHNRRVDYWEKLSVKFPFSYSFEELTKEWLAEKKKDKKDQEPYVLRDRRILRSLEQSVLKGNKVPDDVTSEHVNSLVPVRLECIARGKPKKFGLICLPRKEDMEKVRRRHTIGPVIVVQPARHTETEEVSNGDEAMECAPSEVDVKESKKKWQDDMWKGVVSTDPSTREKPINMKMLFPDKIIVDRRVKRRLLNKKKKDCAKRRKVERLSRLKRLEEERLSKESVTYKDSANRLTIGRIVRGDYSFASSHGYALGYVPLAVLQDVVDVNNVVLLRNSTSKYYHPAKLSILTDMCEL